MKTNPGLKRSHPLWLKDEHVWTRRQVIQFDDLTRQNLKSHRAFRIKETLRERFRTAPDRERAEPLLERWYSWARRSRIAPIKQVAESLKNHWDAILKAFDSKLTSGRVEAANGQIQAAKANARAYGTTRHLITITHLVAGKLTHLPASPFKIPVAANTLLQLNRGKHRTHTKRRERPIFYGRQQIRPGELAMSPASAQPRPP